MIEIHHDDDDLIMVYFYDEEQFGIDYETYGREGMAAAVKIVEDMAYLSGFRVVHT